MPDEEPDRPTAHDTKVKDSRARAESTISDTWFRQMFMGLSFEQSFLGGLDTDVLAGRLRYIYSLLTY